MRKLQTIVIAALLLSQSASLPRQALLAQRIPGPGGTGAGATGPRRISSAIASSTSNVSALSVSYTPSNGNTMAVACFSFGATVTSATVTDNGSNSYTSLYFRADGIGNAGNFRSALSYANTIAGSPTSFTCTWNVATIGHVIVAVEYAGLVGGVTGTAAAQGGNAGGGTTASSPSITTTTAAAVLIATVATTSSANPCTLSPQGSFSVVQAQLNGASIYCGDVQEQIVSATGTYQALTTINNLNWVSGIAGLK